MQWIDGSDKISSNDVGDENLDVKSDEDESVGKRGAPQLGILELKLEQPRDPDKGAQKTSPAEEKTQNVLPDSEEETREAPLDPGQETREASSDRKEKA